MSSEVRAAELAAASNADATGWPWRRGVAWLIFLVTFFFVSYCFANWWTQTHANPGQIVFAWESHIPFLAWTIVPYWSIDLLYGFSFLLCRSKKEVDFHAYRLLTAQIIAVACFLAFPLRFTLEKPAVHQPVFAALYTALAGFDKPFNQSPSLHIVLLIILVARYWAHTRGWLRYLLGLWLLLIGVSVLTTYQHHFIDIPTGALLGFFCLWLWPEQGATPFASWKRCLVPQRKRMSLVYFTGSIFCASWALWGGVFLWALWPAFSLLIVALIYCGVGAVGFQKHAGQISMAARVLLMPYLICAWLNSRIWTYKHPQPHEIADGVWLGRMPSKKAMQTGRFVSLLDVTAELSCPRGGWNLCNLAWLDLVPPDAGQLQQAAMGIESLRRPLLVCCALGYSRSASAVAAWLLLSQRARSVDEAIAMIAARRSKLVLSHAHRAELESFRTKTMENVDCTRRG